MVISVIGGIAYRLYGVKVLEVVGSKLWEDVGHERVV